MGQSGCRTKKTGKVLFGVSLVQHGEISGFKIFCTALHQERVVHSCCDCYLKMDSNLMYLKTFLEYFFF